MSPNTRPSSGRSALALAVVAALALLASACTDDGDPPVGLGQGEGAAGLLTDLSCDQLVDITQHQAELARSNVSGFALAGEEIEALAAEADGALADEAQESGAATTAPAGRGGAGEVVAGTNLQEAAVDEGDIVKTDGSRIVALTRGQLRVVNLDGSPEVDAQLGIGSSGAGGAEMFLRGDEVVLLLPVWQGDPLVDSTEMPSPFPNGVQIMRVDLAGDTPELVETVTVEGSLVSSRMVDGTVRVVLRSAMPFMQDVWAAESTVDLSRPEEMQEAFDEVIASIGPDDVLPRMASGGTVSSIGTCGDVTATPLPTEAETAGLAGRGIPVAQPETVTVLTIDEDLADLAPATVSGSADIVYASPEAMYVTSTGWGESGPTTFVHRFGTPAGEPTSYTGSGLVPGMPLNQYSLSESDADLRIVTTTEDMAAARNDVTLEDDVLFAEPPVALEEGPPVAAQSEPAPDGGADAPIPATEGRLAVLRSDESGTLVEIGHVEDLGIGERVQSVRFIGDMAYVVTFRQTDPLYAIDLSDPTAPTALGELKITGFSEYMHPVGDGLLLGIGREATEEGLDTGFKASLFDVSDPSNPTEVDKWVVQDAYSPVGNDPHAFTWDPVAGQAVFPLERYGFGVEECPAGAGCEEVTIAQPSSAAVVLAVRDDALEPVAELFHDTIGADLSGSNIMRSMVVDRDLWTLSPDMLGLWNADSPTAATFVAFD